MFTSRSTVLSSFLKRWTDRSRTNTAQNIHQMRKSVIENELISSSLNNQRGVDKSTVFVVVDSRVLMRNQGSWVLTTKLSVTLSDVHCLCFIVYFYLI